MGLWQDLVRDIVATGGGMPDAVRDPELLEEFEVVARRLPPAAAAAQLRRLDVAGERLAGNVSPELVLDALALEWVA